jgi:hypothetical protein
MLGPQSLCRIISKVTAKRPAGEQASKDAMKDLKSGDLEVK